MATMVSNLELIRRVPLFSMLTSVQAESVSAAVVKRRFKRGEDIVQQGKKTDALTIILTGRARVITTDTRGREVILATLQPGAYVGEMSLIEDGPRSADAIAETRVVALRLSGEAFERLRMRHPALAAKLMHNISLYLSGRLRGLTTELADWLGR